jgi:pre-mRNA-splicing factor SYF2
MERFKNLHKQRVSFSFCKFNSLLDLQEESRKLNHNQVVEEDRQLKLPRNFESKRKRKEWELEDIEARKEAEERGEDYERNKALNVQADVAEKIQAAKRRKKKPDEGWISEFNTRIIKTLIHYFSDYEAMSVRQYERLTSNLKPDMETYQKMKSVM